MSFQITYLVKDHQVGVDLWKGKQHLINSFYGDFYDFINKQDEGKKDLLAKNIHNKEEFIAFGDWYADGLENCYGIGFGFYKYFLSVDEVYKTIDKQPTTTFIGYCYHNNKYLDFLNFLITYFAWWRNDEHCTSFDPYNHADEFFNSSWAALVDTAKLFYFTSETVFHWHSFRIKYVLDNIPGVIKSEYQETVKCDKKVELKRIRIAGYEFINWVNEKGEVVTSADHDMVIYAVMKRKDFYDYWGTEEKTIKKVYDPNYTKVDPA